MGIDAVRICKNTPFPKQYTILSNKWGAIHSVLRVF